MLNTEVVEFKVENFDKIVKKYTPLISNCSYLLHKKYKTVLDFEDAKQEVLMCMWRCLKYYDPKKFKFMTYFYFSFRRLEKTYYYSIFDQINIAQRASARFINSENQIMKISEESCNLDDEKFVSEDKSLSFRTKLSPNSAEVFEVYMRSYKVSPWLVSQELNISRQTARHMYQQFKIELGEIFQVSEKKVAKVEQCENILQ